MEDFLKFIITPLLSDPKALKIHEQGSIIHIQTSPEDAGRIIGKQGNVINAIRNLSRVWSTLKQTSPVLISVHSKEDI